MIEDLIASYAELLLSVALQKLLTLMEMHLESLQSNPHGFDSVTSSRRKAFQAVEDA